MAHVTTTMNWKWMTCMHKNGCNENGNIYFVDYFFVMQTPDSWCQEFCSFICRQLKLWNHTYTQIKVQHLQSYKFEMRKYIKIAIDKT